MEQKDQTTFRILFAPGAFLPLVGLVFNDFAAIGWIAGLILMLFALTYKMAKHGQV
ncbi:MAG: hypothetical protein ACRCWS_07690 [Propionibacteriaceae bacterium]